MAGLYTHTPRAAGEVITADEYNGDHQNHINNAASEQLSGHSASESQMQTTVNPGIPGAASLAVTIADEFTRLRWVIKSITGLAHWYSPIASSLTGIIDAIYTLQGIVQVMKGTVNYTTVFVERFQPLVGTMIPPGQYGSSEWEPDVLRFHRSFWRVPESWSVGTDAYAYFYRTATVTSGTAKMNVEVVRTRVGAPLTLIGTANVDFVSTSLNTVVLQVTILGSWIQAGDMIRLDLYRFGSLLIGGVTNPNDTLEGSMVFSGAFVGYTGKAGAGY